MLKKFIDGIVFGSGFSIAFIIIWSISANLFLPTALKVATSSSDYEEGFENYPLDKKIQKSTGIAISEYRKDSDGELKSIIKEFLKKNPDAKIQINIGDEHPGTTIAPRKDISYGDGVVIFFTGSPATMREAMTYENDEISALGDLSLQQLREKVQ